MKFSDKPETRKGALGEAIVHRHLESRGLIVYQPQTDGAHPFDNLCASRDKKTIVIAEVKTKPRRLYYPDTGIDIRHYNDYMHIQTKYGIPVFLYFVDAESEKRIYGNKLIVLIASRQVEHNGKLLTYPIKSKGIIYFPLDAMLHVADLDAGDTQEIAALTTRNEHYKYAG